LDGGEGIRYGRFGTTTKFRTNGTLFVVGYAVIVGGEGFSFDFGFIKFLFSIGAMAARSTVRDLRYLGFPNGEEFAW